MKSVDVFKIAGIIVGVLSLCSLLVPLVMLIPTDYYYDFEERFALALPKIVTSIGGAISGVFMYGFGEMLEALKEIKDSLVKTPEKNKE